MNRRLWVAVAVTVTILATVSFVAGPATVRSGLERLTTWAGIAAELGGRLPWWLVGVIAATALAAVGGLLWRERRLARGNRAPWHQVIALARGGHRPLAIARSTGLPQDVVRIVLAPVAPDSSAPRGNSFRAPPGVDQERSAPDRRRPRS